MTHPSSGGCIVIVGAGLAGANAAVELRAEGFRGRLVLLGDEETLPFGRPPLSKTYLRAEEPLDAWFVRPADWYDANEVELRRGASMSRVDTDAKEIWLQRGERIRYDHVVLCTGGRPRTPALPGIHLPGVHVLRTVADCDAIKHVAKPRTRAVVVGMGFIGSEVAASLNALNVSVTAVLSGRSPLETVLGAEAGAVMAGIHREHGVELIPQDAVVAFEGEERLKRVRTKTGVRIECDFAVVGAGIEPNVEPVAATSVALDNGILVDARCRTNVAGIYAAGDVANHLHPIFGRVRVEHYNNAEKMGAAVARSILGDDRPYDYVHTFWSDQFEHKLEYVGHAAKWDQFVVRGSIEDRKFLGFYLTDGILRAAVGLNRGGDPELDVDDDMAVALKLVAEQAAPPAAALADERTDLRSLRARGSPSRGSTTARITP